MCMYISIYQYERINMTKIDFHRSHASGLKPTVRARGGCAWPTGPIHTWAQAQRVRRVLDHYRRGATRAPERNCWIFEGMLHHASTESKRP